MMAKRDKKPTEIVNKTVSFNLADPDQLADYEFAGRRSNFSSFVKFLIRQERLRPVQMEMVMRSAPAPVKEKKGDVISASLDDSWI